MTTKEQLEAARAWLSDPEHWCKGNAGMSTNGPTCAIGAINRAVGFQGGVLEAYITPLNREAVLALAAVLPPAQAPQETIWSYNDNHSHECVLAAFDAAIERLP